MGGCTGERSVGEEVRSGENITVGRKCAGVQGRLQVGGSRAREGIKPAHQFGSDLTIYKATRKEDLSWSLGVWPRPTWTWASSSKQSLRVGSTPFGQPDYTTVE